MGLYGFFSPLHEARLVRTTVPTRRDAEALAKRLVEQRLAACVHVQETSSVYRWDGAVRQETEFVVEARTTNGRRDAVAKAMRDGHPYDVPLVELSSTFLDPAYSRWMKGEVA